MMKKILYFLLILLPLQLFAEEARMTRSGIIIVGTGDSVRAFEPFRGTLEGGTGYADAQQVMSIHFERHETILPLIFESASSTCRLCHSQ